LFTVSLLSGHVRPWFIIGLLAVPLLVTACSTTDTSDASTTAARATTTGPARVVPVTGLAANSSGVPIEPEAWNRNDGFSPNTPLLGGG
jgi:hypothetical protein